MQDHGGITAPEEGQQVRLADVIAAILRYPACKMRLCQGHKGYACTGCGRVFPIVNGVAQFVPANNYAENFGFEWQLYCRTQLDSDRSREWESAFRDKTGFTPEELSGQTCARRWLNHHDGFPEATHSISSPC
jgi:hypothetical protein